MSYEKRRSSKSVVPSSAQTLREENVREPEVVVLLCVPLVSRLLRGNLCVQWIKTDKLELGREAACDLAALPALESATTTMCGRLNGGFFYFLLSHIIYHCSLSSLRRGKSVKLEERLARRGRSNMRNGLSKEERETQEGGADGRWRDELLH